MMEYYDDQNCIFFDVKFSSPQHLPLGDHMLHSPSDLREMVSTSINSQIMH